MVFIYKHCSVESNKILEIEDLDLFKKRVRVGIIFEKGYNKKSFLLKLFAVD